ncbi:hypothetical protein VNI00_013140 [Paramarasmius palmivorus]|uniref:F-box domain-containing protein n=1 Tax=Paramarasmius palmivorus TaxID=297713 RepID=A0AAW0C1P6_9AGAR
MKELLQMPHTVLTPVFDNLPIQDIVKLRTISGSAYADVQGYYKTTFSISKLYDPFFPNEGDSSTFQSLVTEAGGLVTSFTLIDILSRQPLKLAPLYLFTPAKYVAKAGNFLLDLKFGFNPLPQKTVKTKTFSAQSSTFHEALIKEHRESRPNTGELPELCDDSTVSGVFGFSRGNATVWVVGTRTEPIEVILTFHSRKRIISLYPKTSFVEKRALILNTPSPSTQIILQTYENAGWTLSSVIAATDLTSPDNERSLYTRWIGDSHTWVLDMEEEPHPTIEYRSLQVTSWHLDCPDIDRTTIVYERMEHNTLAHSYVITWEAERAVWGHPCFSDLDPNRLDDCGDAGHPDVEEVDLFSDTDSETSESSVDTTESFLESTKADMKQCEYMVTRSSCQHRAINSASDVEPAIVEYLHGFYPLMRETHRTNYNIRKMRTDLLDLHDAFPNIAGHIQYPSGHVICVILQTVEDVRRSGRCKSVKYTLDFTLATATNRITTTCTIKVPKAEVNNIENIISVNSAWSQEHLTEAGLTVMIVENGTSNEDD